MMHTSFADVAGLTPRLSATAVTLHIRVPTEPDTRNYGTLPAASTWVRVPSSASEKAPLRRGFSLLAAVTTVPLAFDASVQVIDVELELEATTTVDLSGKDA
jgi:hypothetical protein